MPSASAHRRAQGLQVGGRLLGPVHGGQGPLGPRERALGAAADSGMTARSSQVSSAVSGTETSAMSSPVRDVGRGHRRLPLLVGRTRRPRRRRGGRPSAAPCRAGSRWPPRTPPAEDDQAPGGRVVQVGELLGQPDAVTTWRSPPRLVTRRRPDSGGLARISSTDGTPPRIMRMHSSSRNVMHAGHVRVLKFPRASRCARCCNRSRTAGGRAPTPARSAWPSTSAARSPTWSRWTPRAGGWSAPRRTPRPAAWSGAC